MKKHIYLYILLLTTWMALLLPGGVAVAATRQQVQEYIQRHDYEKALPALRQLMSQPANRRDADMNKWYGQTLCMTGAYAESLPYLETGAKGGKTGAYWYLGISLQHLYDYDGAIEALEFYRSKCSETSGWRERTDSIIAECQLGQRAMQHVQDVVIIDSLQVPQSLFWQNYLPGAESGRLLMADDCGDAVRESAGSQAVVFENQPGNCRVWSVDGEDASMLYQSHAFQGQWETPQAIPSVASTGYRICYPWQRTDGETLYFACDSTPGLGGLDIYMTTYDADTESYRSPQRLGMPFNSPYNDYMMAIDEQHQVGWWATDRNAAPGMVTLYLFLVEEEPEYLDGPQPERARISAIADTWREEEGYQALVEKLRQTPQQAEEVTVTLRIPIDDHTVYTSADQFRNTEARRLYLKAVSLHEELAQATERLEELRISYHNMGNTQRKSLSAQILPLERRVNELEMQIRETEKEYRNVEGDKK